MNRTLDKIRTSSTRSITFAVLATAAALLSGCIVTSVSPFYTAKDLVSEPGVLGQWAKSGEPTERWKFEAQGSNACLVTYMTGNQTHTMEGRFFKLQGQLFLDLYPGQGECDLLPPPIPSHLLLRVAGVSPTLRMGPMNHGWLKELLDKDSTAIRHHFIRDETKPEDVRVVLTASTPELQRFVIDHLGTKAAWGEALELRKE